MTLWIIEPQDPLIVRDGRPFNATPGARARSLPFPFPSTTAGGVRTRAGQNKDGIFDTTKVDIVKKIDVRGPLLAEIKKDGGLCFMVPAPADALVFDADKEKNLIIQKWLRPLTLPNGANHDQPDNFPPYLVGLPNPDSRKPSKNTPAFWRWKNFQDWLLDPAGVTTPIKTTKLGHDGPQPDRRMHVKIDPTSFTGEDSALFTTSGLTFWHQHQGKDDESLAKLSLTKKLALVLAVENLNGLKIDQGFAPLGGERRLMNWRKANNSQAFPEIPNGLIDQIVKNNGCCRLILLTPAYFEKGWLPGNWGSTAGTTVTLQAAVVAKPVVVSGWDMAAKPPGPKVTKRLAPAGTVYFVRVEGDIEQWVQDRWLQPLSDDEELAKAGFGLTAVGVGSKPQTLTIIQEENNG